MDKALTPLEGLIQGGKLLKLNYQDYAEDPVQNYLIFTKSRVLSPLLEEFRQAPARVLDLGTGTGDLMIDLAQWQEGTTAVGYDIFSQSIERAKAKIQKTGLGERVHAEVKDMEAKFDFPLESFDLISMIGCIQFARNPKTLLSEKLTHLKKNGVLLVAAHHRYCLYGVKLHLKNLVKLLSGKPEECYKFFSVGELKRLAKTLDLEVEKVDGFVIMPPWLYEMMMSKKIPAGLGRWLLSGFLKLERQLENTALKPYLSRTLVIKCRKR